MSIRHDDQAAPLARALGWFSIVLGLAQLAVPDTVSRLVGVRPTGSNRLLMRSVGVRELVAGTGLLTVREPSGFLWARVAGDAMDLSLLGKALASDSERTRAGMATAAVAGVTVLDLVAGARRSSADAPAAA